MIIEPVLCARQLVKRFGGIVALDRADFDLAPGQIVAVVGETGSGRTALLQSLAGALAPEAGEIKLDGHPLVFHDPAEAWAVGIEMAQQRPALVPGLSFAENLFLGREVRRAGMLGQIGRMLDRRHMRDMAIATAESLGIAGTIDIDQPVERLSRVERRLLSLARAAAFASRVVIADEPTEGLDAAGTSRVLDVILEVRARGLSIVLAAQNLPHVFELVDRIHIQRLGRRLCVVDPAYATPSDVAAMISGTAGPRPDMLVPMHRAAAPA
ncbi:ATP-binding cassette domain-containing protein [Consotaella aegiceratis]|uniref:ATP-binding cassette domain-containing protein n=1 Tax=Consotaella aegiceratis TaxID=3097961 RepID=UPI002F413FBB